MKKLNITQGKWFVSGNNIIRTKDVECVALAHGSAGKCVEVEAEHTANAKLIAAAPDLLNALVNISNEIINGTITEITINNISAAIKKATT